MTIGFDVSPLGTTGGGIARYTYELLAALGHADPNQVMVPVGHRRLAAGALPPTTGGARAVRGPRFPSRAAWTFGVLPFWLRTAGLDVFHATSYYAPLGSRVPTVVTCHDLSVFAFPETHPWPRVLRARALLGRAARGAAAVITPSEFARQEAARWLDVPVARIHVVPGAPAAHFAATDDVRSRTVAARHGLEPGFFLALGTVEPRKNLGNLVEAVARLRRAGHPVRLAVAGRLGWRYRPLLEQVDRLGLADLVRFIGFVPDDELPALMGAAAAAVYPSLYEGFGLPIVESMAAGLPVITSEGGATAEVAGGAALLVDPRDVEAIAGAMRAVEAPGLRSALRAAGLRRAAEFSWARSARETLAVYDAVSIEGASRS